MRDRVLKHKRAVVLQTMWEMPDLHDFNAIKLAKQKHNAAMFRLIKNLRDKNIDEFMIGASFCNLCDVCAVEENKPCILL